MSQSHHDVARLRSAFFAHRRELQALAHKITGRRELAEDVVQDTYLKLADVSGGPAVQQPLAYCCQVVRNLAIDCRRRMSLEAKVFADGESGEHVPGRLGVPEQHAIDRQHLGIVDQVLRTVPPRTRLAFEMHRVNGMTQRAIGAQIGVSAASVNTMIRDAAQALASCRYLLEVE